ncbi:AAA family ATPase [Microbacterium sp. AZCO]|uniref:AAA family ATPase n=1 Tax=Microbacterium sp. AZCO TaxID=3142976 RepID=UPI0031F472AC
MTTTERRGLWIEYESQWIDPSEWEYREDMSADQLVVADRIVTEGSFHLNGQPMAERQARWMRSMLLDKGAGTMRVPEGLRHLSGSEGRRFLIEDLWPWGTYPMIGGAYKAGKTTLVADLVASLLVPERPFLGRFGVTLTEEERQRGIVVINAETPAEDFENALLAAGIDPHEMFLNVYHLDELGGPGQFDLTNPANFDEWEREFVQCNDCWGEDFWTPAVVIVDGVTAILGGPDRYGEWYGAFKRLMKSADIPNAIATGHNAAGTRHLFNATAAMAGPDGVWSYTTARPDDPKSRRDLSVLARVGGVAMPETRVRVDDEGRLTIAKPTATIKPEATAHDHVEDAAVRMLAKLTEATTEWVGQTDLTGKGRHGQFNRLALERLRETGRAEVRVEGMRRWWRAATSSAPDSIVIDLSDHDSGGTGS